MSIRIVYETGCPSGIPAGAVQGCNWAGCEVTAPLGEWVPQLGPSFHVLPEGWSRVDVVWEGRTYKLDLCPGHLQDLTFPVRAEDFSIPEHLAPVTRLLGLLGDWIEAPALAELEEYLLRFPAGVHGIDE